jgi:hypothetical protein
MTSAAFFGVMLAAFAISRGVGTFDSALAAAILMIQVPAGALIWLRTSAGRHATVPTVLGAGLAIGSILSAVTDQIFVNLLGVAGIGALLPGLACLPAFFQSVRPSGKCKLVSETQDFEIIAVAVSGSLFLLAWGNEDQSLAIAAVAIALVAFVFASFPQNFAVPRFSQIRSLVLAAICVATLFGVSPSTQVPDGSPEKYRDITLGSDDQIKSEQLSIALATRGFESNSAAISRPIKFHGLSLAWVGGMTTSGNDSPFVHTLHIVPLSVLAAIGFLVYHLLSLVGASHRVRLAGIIVSVVAANPDGSLRIVHAITTSNIVPLLWIMLLLLVLVEQDSQPGKKSIARLVLIALTPSAVMLGKGPYGVVVATGLIAVLAAVVLNRSRRRDNRGLVASLATGLVLQAVSYVFFLRAELTDSFEIGLQLSRFPSPLPFRFTSDPGISHLIEGSIVLFLFLVLRYVPLVGSGFKKLLQLPGLFAVGGAAGGILSFVVYQSDGTMLGSETYFLNAALFITGCSGIYVCFRRMSYRFVMATVTLAVVLLVSVGGLSASGGLGVRNFVLLGVATVVLGLLATYEPRLWPKPQMVGTFLVVATGLFGIVRTPLVDSSKATIASVVSADELEVFEWIRQNSPKSALFVTNRQLCSGTISCGGNGMPTAAAFTQRGFVIEGLRTLTPASMWGGPPPPLLLPLVRETEDVLGYLSGSRELTQVKTRASWALVYLDEPISEANMPNGMLRHLSESRMIGVFELPPMS